MKSLKTLFFVRKSFWLWLSIMVVGIHGASIVVSVLPRLLLIRHDASDISTSVYIELLTGLTLIYLWSLLLRHKRNAWLVAVSVYLFLLGYNLDAVIMSAARHDMVGPEIVRRLILPAAVVIPLFLLRRSFTVHSDMQSFRSAIKLTSLLLVVTFLYGVGGFMMLDNHDFHQEISPLSAAHYTLDRFDLTTAQPLRPQTKRAELFMQSLSVLSIGALIYALLAFFQPLKNRRAVSHQDVNEAIALIEAHPRSSEDFFKTWPKDKHYLFTPDRQAALGYKVAHGVALVAGDIFGARVRSERLIQEFEDMCYVNDWLPAIVYTGSANRNFYEKHDYSLQLIGREAVVDVAHFQTELANNKYFRQIRNRYAKLDYATEWLKPPHSTELLDNLRQVSDEWLQQPGRTERGFMLGYFSVGYMQKCEILVARDADGKITAFLNRLPSPVPAEASYDLLRSSQTAPGNSNDYLLMSFIDQLASEKVARLNLGLCPLAGVDETDENSIVNVAMRFIYANGNRFYSFRGLERFKAKYEPEWHDRFIAYKGGVRGFSKTMRALTSAMKIS